MGRRADFPHISGYEAVVFFPHPLHLHPLTLPPSTPCIQVWSPGL